MRSYVHFDWLIRGISPHHHAQVKDAHKKIMLLNHPDRGGSPYLAAKINEAKDLMDAQKWTRSQHGALRMSPCSYSNHVNDWFSERNFLIYAKATKTNGSKCK